MYNNIAVKNLVEKENIKMTNQYEIYEMIQNDENIGCYSTYGIKLVDELGEEILHVDDVSTEFEAVKYITELLNKNHVSKEHTIDILSEIIG